MSEIKICYLYPDVLGLYGDGGNVTVLQKRLEWRGIGASVTRVNVGESFNADDYDLFFIGGGQDFEQGVKLDDLAGEKSAEIKKAVEDNKVFLAVSNGYQILGNYYKTSGGVQHDFVGALNIHTVGQKERATGNFCFSVPELDGLKVAAFENHAGKTYLGEGVQPLGRVIKGFGNNGEDGTEGARYKNVFASYGHGSLLSKNPELADEILSSALERKYGKKFDLAPLDDTFEIEAKNKMLKRLDCE